MSSISIPKNNNLKFGAEDIEKFFKNFLDLDTTSASIFLITGHKSFESSGVAGLLSPLLAGRKITRFSDFTANPKIEELQCALGEYKKSNSKLIIAVGGGTALDIAKLVNYFAATKIEPEEYIKGIRGDSDNFSPLMAVPTTAGTGSEATHFSALYISFEKISIADKRMIPTHVWLNPEFTSSMSPYLTACTGFDALAQAIESYWAVASTKESRKYSAEALKLCLKHIEGAVLNPTPEHRSGMLEAAHLAGKAINIAKTTAAHAMSYALTSHYGLPHGHAVAMTLPVLFEVNASFRDNDVIDPRGPGHLSVVIAELYELFHVDSPLEVVHKLSVIMERVGLYTSWISKHNIDPQKAREFILQEINEERLLNNPRKLTKEISQKIVNNIN